MDAWTSDEISKIGSAEELQLASRRRDDTLRKPVTMWVVPCGDSLYVRSVNGRTGAWFRGTQVRHEGHIWVGGVERDVSFVDAEQDINDQIDAMYRSKYCRYGDGGALNITSPDLPPGTVSGSSVDFAGRAARE